MHVRVVDFRKGHQNSHENMSDRSQLILVVSAKTILWVAMLDTRVEIVRVENEGEHPLDHLL